LGWPAPWRSAREALALFRGEPLADVADEPFAPLEIRRLEDLRQTAAELAIEADLAAARHQQALGEIDALLAANPWRERLHAQRMLALYRCGRQAEALEAYRHGARRSSRRSASGPEMETGASSARFTPDGRVLAVGTVAGDTRLFSTRTWKPVSRKLGGHSDEVLEVAVSPDGRTLASGSWDGTVRLFDIATQQPLGAPLRAVANRPVEPEFTPDGAYLYTVTNVGKAYRWEARPSAWARRACAVAGRSLTRTEWSDALPGRTHDPPASPGPPDAGRGRVRPTARPAARRAGRASTRTASGSRAASGRRTGCPA